MRWRSLLEPCGSHHDDARALKWETSCWLTELGAGGVALSLRIVLFENWRRFGGEGVTANARLIAIARKPLGSASSLCSGNEDMILRFS